MSTPDAGSTGGGGGGGAVSSSGGTGGTVGGGGADKTASSGSVNVSKTSSSVGGTVAAVAAGAGGGTAGGGQLSATAVVGGGAAAGGGGGGGGAGGATVTTTTIPIDLASASKVLVRPEKTTMSTTTYRLVCKRGQAAAGEGAIRIFWPPRNASRPCAGERVRLCACEVVKSNSHTLRQPSLLRNTHTRSRDALIRIKREWDSARGKERKAIWQTRELDREREKEGERESKLVLIKGGFIFIIILHRVSANISFAIPTKGALSCVRGRVVCGQSIFPTTVFH